MYGLRARVATVVGLALVAGCTSPAPPESDFLLGSAKQRLDAGDRDSALRYTEMSMQRPPFDARDAEIALHLDILRSAGRTEEARALEEFVARFDSGEDTAAGEPHPTRTECFRMLRAMPRSRQLVRKYREVSMQRPFEAGAFLATYEIDASGQPVNIRVVQARHPAAAWLAISAIGGLKVWHSRLEKLDAALFPIPYCVYSGEEDPIDWLSPRVRAFM